MQLNKQLSMHRVQKENRVGYKIALDIKTKRTIKRHSYTCDKKHNKNNETDFNLIAAITVNVIQHQLNQTN